MPSRSKVANTAGPWTRPRSARVSPSSCSAIASRRLAVSSSKVAACVTTGRAFRSVKFFAFKYPELTLPCSYTLVRLATPYIGCTYRTRLPRAAPKGIDIRLQDRRVPQYRTSRCVRGHYVPEQCRVPLLRSARQKPSALAGQRIPEQIVTALRAEQSRRRLARIAATRTDSSPLERDPIARNV